jgi:hypothetical protein
MTVRTKGAVRDIDLDRPRRKPKRRASEAVGKGGKKSPPHQRTLRDFYGEAVRARAGIKPNERNFDENPASMAPGEMLLWSLGGSVCDQELSVALDNVATDIQAFIMAPETHGVPSLPSDVCDAIHGFVNRLQVIRWLHAGALERLGQIVVPQVVEEL